MSVDNIYGPIVTGRTVRQAMTEHLQKWFSNYLAEVSRIEGRNPAEVPVFKSYVPALDMPEGKYEEHQMPSCVIVAPGLLVEPTKTGSHYSATWAVSVGCVVSGQNRNNTFELTELYAAAVRAAVMHKPSLGKFASSTEWLGERYDELPNEMLRTLAAGTVQFAVSVDRVLETYAGPAEPWLDPTLDPGPRKTFVTVDATIEKED